MYPLIVTFRHLLTCFNYNFNKQGGQDVDFAHILLMLTQHENLRKCSLDQKFISKAYFNRSKSQRDLFHKTPDKLYTEQTLSEE